MPSPRKRIGFLPSEEVHDIIDKICRANEFSQSKVTGLLVEEALRSRGILSESLDSKINDKLDLENSYFDNLCHIAHNVQIGRNSAFAAMSGIAGSTKIGNNVLAGGQVGIAGHLCIGDNVQIAAKSGVFNDLDDKQTVMGNPAINKYNYIKAYKKTYGKK